MQAEDIPSAFVGKCKPPTDDALNKFKAAVSKFISENWEAANTAAAALK